MDPLLAQVATDLGGTNGWLLGSLATLVTAVLGYLVRRLATVEGAATAKIEAVRNELTESRIMASGLTGQLESAKRDVDMVRSERDDYRRRLDDTTKEVRLLTDEKWELRMKLIAFERPA